MDDHSYSLKDIVSLGFEARCVDVDGTRYLWHGTSGLKVESRTRITTMITDPGCLPDGQWFATELGEAELAQRDSDLSQ